ncbi:MAG: hypothetical protein ACFKPT_08845 [Gloeotrichia echinulata GP01]
MKLNGLINQARIFPENDVFITINLLKSQGSRVKGQESRIKGQGSRVKGQGSRVVRNDQ